MIELLAPSFDKFSWVLIGAFILPVLIWQWVKRPKNFPPGPVGLPILGVAGSLINRAEVSLMKMSWTHGPIMGVKLLRKFTVVLSSVEAMQNALVKQGHAYAGRPDSIMFQAFTGGRGVLAIDGPRWKENRRFGTVTLRKLGAGRAIMEERIVDEAMYFCEALQIIQKKSFNITKLITHSMANVICGLAFGERFNYDDKRFISTARALVDWFNDNSNVFMLLVFAPFLRHFWPFTNAVKSLKSAREKLYTMLIPIIDRHRETVDDYDYRDFIEAYLQKISQTRDDPTSFYSDKELLGNVRDLFVGGTDTTVNTLRWTIIYLINRPEVQKKIQKEIDRV
uniref:Uncharacterized protein n=3 Tax=Ciona intestinalis TaxID=7719 RepID=F6Y7G2_CIOIN